MRQSKRQIVNERKQSQKKIQTESYKNRGAEKSDRQRKSEGGGIWRESPIEVERA